MLIRSKNPLELCVTQIYNIKIGMPMPTNHGIPHVKASANPPMYQHCCYMHFIKMTYYFHALLKCSYANFNA